MNISATTTIELITHQQETCQCFTDQMAKLNLTFVWELLLDSLLETHIWIKQFPMQFVRQTFIVQYGQSFTQQINAHRYNLCSQQQLQNAKKLWKNSLFEVRLDSTIVLAALMGCWYGPKNLCQHNVTRLESIVVNFFMDRRASMG